MHDKTPTEIEEERSTAIKYLTETFGGQVEIIDSYIRKSPPDATPLWFLGESLKYLSTADVAYF